MSTKRKLMAPLGLSLYDDLDEDSATTTTNSNVSSGDNLDSDSSVTKKKPRKEEVKEESEETSGTGEDDGAVGELLSVCGWRKGEREDMQDAHIRLDQFGLTISSIHRSAFYAIFDGHAGRRAADFAAEHLPARIKRKVEACKSELLEPVTYLNDGQPLMTLSCPNFLGLAVIAVVIIQGIRNKLASRGLGGKKKTNDSDLDMLEKGIKKCFVDTYKQIDERFLVEARRTRPSWKDGTTATTILLVNNVIYCANIGDSKAIVCRSKPENVDIKEVAMQLTVNHSPLQFEERMRIQKAGGYVKDGRVLGMLEVSRSIGDGAFKSYGLICTPDVKKFSITKNDRFVLIACDGLWKTFSSQDAVDFVMTKIRQPRKNAEKSEPETREMIWQSVADDLAAESVKRGCGDNVSVIIIVLNDFEA